MSNMQITHDRTVAIKLALSDFLDPGQVNEAVRLWQDKYSSQPTFSVQYFARECCQLFGVESQRTQLIKSLVRELYMQKVGTEGKEKVVMPAGPDAGMATQVFQLLFLALVNSVDTITARQLIAFVEQGLPRSGLDRNTLQTVQRWIKQESPRMGIALPLPIMVNIINRAYVCLCEYLGPIKADQILHDAVSRVAQTAQGQKFHPQQLL